MLAADPDLKTGFWRDCPDLDPEDETIWAAFWDLSPSRHYGMGFQAPIPFEAIDRYAARFEIEDFEEFHDLIRHMDSVYLEHANPKPAKHGSRGTETRT